MSNLTRLTKTDLEAIEAETWQVAGEPPTLESLAAEGYRESAWLLWMLGVIAGIGRVLTLLIAEGIQSAAALIIGVVFALLEFQRVLQGALALGQTQDAAWLIAIAVVVANVVHPIYALRQLRGKPTHEITHMTGRGYVGLLWRKLTGKPRVESVDWSHNPTLDGAALVISLTTMFLAVYDLLAPILTAILEGTADEPGLILAVKLLMGFGLSLSGVLFLQAGAHEIGVRTLTDQPERLVDVLAARRAEYEARVAAVREEVRERYMAGKLADQERKAHTNPFGSTRPTMDAPESLPVTVNGSGPIGSD